VSPRFVGDGVAHSYKCVGADVVTVAGTLSVNVVVVVVVPVVREPTVPVVVVVPVVPVVVVVPVVPVDEVVVVPVVDEELVPIFIREPPDGDCETSPTDSAN
jgi:hypothetical protein